ncbi:MAG TPA: hypothetical protein VI299_18575 [Polyangiales bacterium]
MRTSLLIIGLSLSACSAGGQGAAKFTTWGEEYIEQEVPADASGESGFVDGWTVKYDKFLVVFHAIEVASSDGEVGAVMSGSKFVDNVVPGRKDLITFADLEAKHWDRVSYQIKPALADSEVVAGSTADRDMMAANGYSIYVSGHATKSVNGQLIQKTFHWGFKTATQYSDCLQSSESGQPLEGIVVTNGGTDTSELTTHGDHFFYDRLMSSPNPAVKTSLRFEEKAAADTNDDGEITLEELLAQNIDVRLYDPSGFDAPKLGLFMTALARTVGHFRGEGECRVSAIP